MKKRRYESRDKDMKEAEYITRPYAQQHKKWLEKRGKHIKCAERIKRKAKEKESSI